MRKVSASINLKVFDPKSKTAPRIYSFRFIEKDFNDFGLSYLLAVYGDMKKCLPEFHLGIAG
ncbi:MAG: hypothetical protein HC897_14110 [Thermoanaerobaculia bacterium]|nr:hypothetical protein [Thermoanaerobaculia bacterium]